MDKTLGTYKLIREIGKGGMGIVYKALMPGTQNYVALKVLPPAMVDRSTVERFNREVRAMKQLRHDNLLGVLDAGMEKGQHYLVMEYVDGESLKAMVRRRGGLPAAEAVDIAAQVAGALVYMHGEGMIHRDIKPTNIMVAPDGRVKLMDYGLVKIAGVTNVTIEGTALGTPEYMSPEQVNGEEVDSRTDLYSLGATLYEMLTGDPPYQADSARAVMEKQRNEPVPSVRARNAGVPAEIERVVGRAMAKNVADRYQRAEEMRADLERLRAGAGPAGRPPAGRPPAPGSTEVAPRRPAAEPTKIADPRRGGHPVRWLVAAALIGAAGYWVYTNGLPGPLRRSLPGGGGDLMRQTESSLEMMERADDHHLRGLGHFSDGRVDDAIAEYQEAIALFNDHAPYYKDLALAYERKNDVKSAVRAWRDLLKYDPKGPYADLARQHLELLEK